MFISARRFIGPAFVFSLGLCSCQPNSGPAAPFRVAEPQWELKNGQTMRFVRASNELPTRDLTDMLTFPDGPAAVQIQARCLDGSQILHSSHRFALPNKIAVYSMLPEELLAPSRMTDSAHVRCSVDFHVFNGEGSVHNFHMPEVLIEDHGTSDGVTARFKSQSLRQDDFEKFRFVVAYGTEAKLTCDDVEFSTSIPGNRQVTLADFGPIEETQWRERAQRRCRLLGINQGLVQSLSAPLEIQFHGVMPKIEYLPARLFLGETFFKRGPVPLLTFVIKNDQSFPFRFHLIKPSEADFAGAAFEPHSEGNLIQASAVCAGGLPIHHQPILTIEKPQAKVSVRDGGDFFSIELPPGTTIGGSIVTTVAVPNRNRPAAFRPTSYLFKQIRPMRLETYQIENGIWLQNGVHEWGFFGWVWTSDVEVRLPDTASMSCS